MTARVTPERAAALVAAQGSAPPVADPAGVSPPLSGAPAQTSRPEGSPTPLQGGASTSPRRERAATGMPSPGTGEADPAAGNRLPASPGRGRPQSPAGGAPDADDALPAGSTGRTYTIALPAGLKLLSLNGREHWAVRHRRSQAIKEAAWALAKQARIPALERVAVLVEYRPPDRRHRDAENTCIPSAKAAIDGIVAAGVLPDDECPRYVTKIACTIGEPHPKGMLVLHLIEVTA